jgi:hypothetical protein
VPLRLKNGWTKNIAVDNTRVVKINYIFGISNNEFPVPSNVQLAKAAQVPLYFYFSREGM